MFTGMTGDRSPRRRRRGAAAAAAAATAVLVVTLDGVDGFSPVVPATNDTPHRRRLLQHHPAATTATRLDQAPGSSGDYLSRLSNDGDDLELGSLNDDELVSGGKTNSSPSRPSLQSAITAASDLPRQAKEGASGLTSSFVANVGNLGERASGGVNELTRGTSEYLQNLAGSSLRGVNRISRKGGIDIKRARLRAERVAKKSTDSLAMAGGLSDLNFFGVGSIDTPKVDAEEIVKWMESQTKSGTEMVGQGTEAVGLMAKRLVLKFTGKDTYQFGDVTKALVHRISSQEINVTDTILLLKILLALGTTIGPFAELLPFTFLVEVLNVSLEQKVGGKVLEVLTKTLDNRLVAALFTADDKSLIGDVVRRTVLGGILAYTGKSSYEAGDLQRAVKQNERGESDAGSTRLELDVAASSEFEEWDRLFVERIESDNRHVGERAKELDAKIALALEECDAIAQKRGPS
ncbi:hypothetical protein THAOC_12664 [Thalassiosira oceanica]|uniref:Uncharacterized protein n=1 Tax=Thalassiosira oceanica TaxID=159749 RepID=K0T7G1_THAOC|nr:hypothetical protein THAOC_12664 [Thalassiosira oceanica]|eukprot:EJK66422.1 hypothetical protein THAOC_12664 [Thalassiosira oceanica]